MPEDRGPVLGADVVALPHALGRVVRLPEHLEQIAVGDVLGVEHHPDRLGVTGAAGADFLVRRVRREPALIPDRGRDDAWRLPELPLRAPEAPERELGHLAAVRIRRQQWRAEHFVGRGNAHLLCSAAQRLLRGHHPSLAGTKESHGFSPPRPGGKRSGVSHVGAAHSALRAVRYPQRYSVRAATVVPAAELADTRAMEPGFHTRFPCWIPESIAGAPGGGAMDSRIHRTDWPGSSASAGGFGHPSPWPP